MAITTQQATWVRRWRCELKCSYDEVGDHAAHHWALGLGREPGEVICELAASLLGEHPHEEPWV